MDFFGYQQQARRYSALLVVLFALAVLALVLAINALVGWLLVLGDIRYDYQRLADVPPAVYGWTSAATLALIGAGTLRRMWQLGEGGPVVARLAGARWVPPDTTDPARRRLLNVAEEMAVASGLAMPRIYVMDDEPGVNAFAAGHGPRDAVVAVTRGCLERLDRDQLQGVVAHEFSHLLHGDGPLNIRLLGLLHGITAPGALGMWLVRSAVSPGIRRGEQARVFPPQLLAGLALAAVGYLGVLLARLIRAAVSRQREHLADAAGVQFTRNPRGLAGALRRIREEAGGASLRTAQAEAFSHMLFATASRSWLNRLLATHPPLDVRIGRIYPLFARSPVSAPQSAPPVPEPVPAQAPAAEPRAVPADALAGLVGHTDVAGLGYAAALLDAIPASLRQATRSADAAGALLGGLLAAPGLDAAEFERRLGSAAAPFAQQYGQAARRLGPRARLPLIDLALPVLQAQPAAWQADLLHALHTLAGDAPDTWPVLALLRHHLAPAGSRRGSAGAAEADLRQVLRTLADCAGGGGDDAYAAACGKLDLPAIPVAAERAAFEAALQRLALAPLAQRLALLGAGAVAVGHDGVVEVDELETLRLIGAALDCPLPPLAGASP
ncbi:MAG: M48 family metalloprotease [Immundisolibacter sp.]|uniref:M48 family metalloprotease n=1 Tax=Immundisolibacter sp. TaxID=1934948 RepID=UPI003D139034